VELIGVAIPLSAAILLDLDIGTELLLKAMHCLLVQYTESYFRLSMFLYEIIFKLDQSFVYVHISRFVLKKNFLTPLQPVELPKYSKKF
jgi:hypothetical protein